MGKAQPFSSLAGVNTFSQGVQTPAKPAGANWLSQRERTALVDKSLGHWVLRTAQNLLSPLLCGKQQDRVISEITLLHYYNPQVHPWKRSKDCCFLCCWESVATLHDVTLSGIIHIIQPNCVSAHHLRSSFLHLWATSVSGDFLKLHWPVTMLLEGFFWNFNHVPKGKLNIFFKYSSSSREFGWAVHFFPKGEGRGRALLLQGAI